MVNVDKTLLKIFVVILLSCEACALVGWFGGKKEGRCLMRKEAIERGFAEYRVIDTDGTSEFFWKEDE